MGYREELEALGVDVAEGLDRVMDDWSLYETMLGIFVDTVNENPITLEDFGKKGTEELADQVHMMKGMTGNLSLTPLFNGYLEMLGLLRQGKAMEARAIMVKLLPVQAKIIECIKKHC